MTWLEGVHKPPAVQKVHRPAVKKERKNKT